MMIDHISMYANKPDKLKDFYEKYFGAQSNRLKLNESEGIRSYFLSFADSSTKLQIINRPEIDGMSKNHIDLGYIRIAFSFDSPEAVDAKAKELKDDGYVILSQPQQKPDGYYDCVILDPDDNQVKMIYGEKFGVHCPIDKQIVQDEDAE